MLSLELLFPKLRINVFYTFISCNKHTCLVATVRYSHGGFLCSLPWQSFSSCRKIELISEVILVMLAWPLATRIYTYFQPVFWMGKLYLRISEKIHILVVQTLFLQSWMLCPKIAKVALLRENFFYTSM
jgi:hypothetical protein